jgi:GNAT superfamily N-acetyltransferase
MSVCETIECEIRPATAADAEGISRIVIRTLRETNARDYSPDIITALVSNYSPERITSLIANREAYVACLHGTIIGTASLQGCAVRTVFVDPKYQGKGVGAKLMDVVERFARAKSLTTLRVPSSLTAQDFYKEDL